MKKLAVFLILFLVILSFTFSGGQKEAQKVSLRYMMWDPQIIDKEQVLADKFTAEHPNVTITLESAAYAQYWEKMQAMAAAKNLPDVFWMSSSTVKDYQSMGALLSMEDNIKKLDKSKYFSSVFGVLRAPTSSGDMYAFPYAWVVCISYYNIRLFDQAGLSYPTNDWKWKDLESAAVKLTKDTDGDETVDQWGYWVKGRYTHLYPFVYNNGLPEGPMTEDKKFTLADGKGLESMKFLTDLIVKDKASPTPAQTKGVSKFFTTGKIGMCTEGSWRVDTYRKSLKDPFGIFLVPTGPQSGGKRVSFGWADSMSISAYTKHPKEAWNWVEYMTGPGRPVDSILGGKVPIWKVSALSDTWKEKGKYPKNKELILEAGKLIGPKVTFVKRWDEANSEIQSGFEKVVLGEGDLNSVMKELKTKVEKILAR
ncbi:MAG: sugar ABC transporter substrate-binding protein [Spirochaetales bacterium]|nr:sugar ABC transporter substrate-binding protein [Spirochaetales bacterium]